MTNGDQISYLNRDPATMTGALVQALNALPAKLTRAPADQWISTLKSLTTKGVKQAEIEDANILDWLNARKEGGQGPVARQELIAEVVRRQVTIKEVVLARPQYKRYSHAGHIKAEQAASMAYEEVLFIANTEKANLDDRLEQIDWELEQFNFDVERLSREPEAVLALEKERASIMTYIPSAHDYVAPHFSGGVDEKYAKNLIAHGRVLYFGDTCLVEEIQSDWGQQGRRENWLGIPKGPFVTDTKQWAGLVMRRLMQRAALNPRVQRFAWIRGSMRNGGLQVTEDNLDEFYLKSVRGIVDKQIAKSGGKSNLATLAIGGHLLAEVPGFEMTAEVRAALTSELPLYSHMSLNSHSAPLPDEERVRFLQRAQHMLGSVAHVKFVDKLYDVATGQRVAGRQINRMIQIALDASMPEVVLDHECFHFAMENLMHDHERSMVLKDFAPGSALNRRTRDTLILLNERGAASQCDDPTEAAAHAYSLWAHGKLDLNDTPVRGIFEALRVLMLDAVSWFRRTVLVQKCATTKDVFYHLLCGGYTADERRYAARGRETKDLRLRERV